MSREGQEELRDMIVLLPDTMLLLSLLCRIFLFMVLIW